MARHGNRCKNICPFLDDDRAGQRKSYNVPAQTSQPPFPATRLATVQIGPMANFLHSSPRVLLRRINARPSQHFSKNPHRRKTSASSENNPNQAKPPKPEDTKAITEPLAAQAVSVKLPLLQRLGPLSRAANAYDDIQKRRPWATQLCASLCVYFCGDMLAQYIDGERYDPLRTLRHLTIGAGASVPGYTWYETRSNRHGQAANYRLLGSCG